MTCDAGDLLQFIIITTHLGQIFGIDSVFHAHHIASDLLLFGGLCQIQGDPQMNFDPARGEVKAPLVLWGPYLWTQGNTPRQFDGLVWSVNDVRADHLHPNEAGTKKTTTLLLNFFKTDPGASRWFLKAGEKGEAAALPK